jgi:glycosyltransferase involved in cell wall biosynthesis
MVCDLIIPALDEAPNIGPLFQSLAPLRNGTLRRIVLADNGSSDDTVALAQEQGAVVVVEPKRGYGAACLKGLAWIKAQEKPPDAIAFLDADLSDDPAAITELLAPIASGAAELVIGSRVARAEPGALSAVQRYGNGLACFLMRILTGRRHTDLGPMRTVTWSALQRLKMADTTWGWTVEMQMKAALLGIPALEVDVPYRRRCGGRSKISGTLKGVVTAGSRIIWTIIALRWNRHPTDVRNA